MDRHSEGTIAIYISFYVMKKCYVGGRCSMFDAHKMNDETMRPWLCVCVFVCLLEWDCSCAHLLRVLVAVVVNAR